VGQIQSKREGKGGRMVTEGKSKLTLATTGAGRKDCKPRGGGWGGVGVVWGVVWGGLLGG